MDKFAVFVHTTGCCTFYHHKRFPLRSVEFTSPTGLPYFAFRMVISSSTPYIHFVFLMFLQGAVPEDESFLITTRVISCLSTSTRLPRVSDSLPRRHRYIYVNLLHEHPSTTYGLHTVLSSWLRSNWRLVLYFATQGGSVCVFSILLCYVYAFFLFTSFLQRTGSECRVLLDNTTDGVCHLVFLTCFMLFFSVFATCGDGKTGCFMVHLTAV